MPSHAPQTPPRSIANRRLDAALTKLEAAAISFVGAIDRLEAATRPTPPRPKLELVKGGDDG